MYITANKCFTGRFSSMNIEDSVKLAIESDDKHPFASYQMNIPNYSEEKFLSLYQDAQTNPVKLTSAEGVSLWLYKDKFVYIDTYGGTVPQDVKISLAEDYYEASYKKILRGVVDEQPKPIQKPIDSKVNSSAAIQSEPTIPTNQTNSSGEEFEIYNPSNNKE